MKKVLHKMLILLSILEKQVICPYLVFFIYLFYFWLCWVFIAACTFSSCGEGGCSLVISRLLLAVASLVAEHGCSHAGFRSCGAWAQWFWLLGSRVQVRGCGAQAQLLCSMWDLPRPGIDPTGVLFIVRWIALTTGPPGMPCPSLFYAHTLFWASGISSSDSVWFTVAMAILILVLSNGNSLTNMALLSL